MADSVLRMKATYYDIFRLCFALIQYWFWSILVLECTGWSWWEHFEEKSGRVHNFPWTLSHLEGNWLEISQTTTISSMLDFLTRFVLVWKLTSYWLLASWSHLIWLCIGELTRRSQAWSLGRQSTDNAWFLQPCPPINMDRSSNWIDRVQLRTRLYKYP